jgi:hypothetical protein
MGYVQAPTSYRGLVVHLSLLGDSVWVIIPNSESVDKARKLQFSTWFELKSAIDGELGQ